LMNKLKGETTDAYTFTPYWHGFTGDVVYDDTSDKYILKGKYKQKGKDKIHITELPIGMWTDDFKLLLESLMESVDKRGKKVKPIIKEYDDMSKSTNVDIIVTFTPNTLESLMSKGGEDLEKILKLTTTCNTHNMHLFNAKEKLTKYTRVQDIIDDYYVTRLEGYTQRKLHIIRVLEKELLILSNKKRYIEETLSGTLDFRRMKKCDMIDTLVKRKYIPQDEDNEFKYLVKMPMDSVTSENVDKIMKEFDDKSSELEYYRKTTEKEFWMTELKEFKDEHVKHLKRYDVATR